MDIPTKNLAKLHKKAARGGKKACHCEPVLRLAWGESRALPVADEARRTSGSGHNFGGFHAAAKLWEPQQEICILGSAAETKIDATAA